MYKISSDRIKLKIIVVHAHGKIQDYFKFVGTDYRLPLTTFLTNGY